MQPLLWSRNNNWHRQRATGKKACTGRGPYRRSPCSENPIWRYWEFRRSNKKEDMRQTSRTMSSHVCIASVITRSLVDLLSDLHASDYSRKLWFFSITRHWASPSPRVRILVRSLSFIMLRWASIQRKIFYKCRCIVRIWVYPHFSLCESKKLGWGKREKATKNEMSRHRKKLF